MNIAILASGSGTNAVKMIEYFKDHDSIHIVVVASNNKDAGVITKASDLGVPTIIFNRKSFYETSAVEDMLKERNVDWIVLAGFLWLVPESLLKKFPERIINIHPSLLPKYGGKGMYGGHVHNAVIANGDSESGITIHIIDDKYDRGQILYQAKCKVNPDDTPETLQKRIQQLEYEHFSPTVEHHILSIIKPS
jgi:phosphoribosylglycinamide formyltransferase-1